MQKIELVFKGLGILLAFLSLILGYIALTTWHKQIRYKTKYESALKLEEGITKFCLYTSGEKSIIGQQKLDGVADQIMSSHIQLIQRGFMVKEANLLYNEYDKCMEPLRTSDTGIVPAPLLDGLFTELNIFSTKLHKKL